MEKIAVESQGNPLFIVESLRMLLDDGELCLEAGRWRLSVDNLGVPRKVREVFLRRLNALNREERRTLDVASVIGEKFATNLLSAALGVSNIKVLETLQSISQSTALVYSEENSFRFVHEKPAT